MKEQNGGLNLPSIKVAVVGVGNCASALIQGLHYYKNFNSDDECVGLRHLTLEVFTLKISKLSRLSTLTVEKLVETFQRPYSHRLIVPPKLVDVPPSGILVHKGPVLDGVGEYTKQMIQVSDSKEVSVADVLKESGAEIVLNLLPSGAVKASEWYASQSLEAGCAFVNATPVFIASNSAWARRFEEAELPLVGDDLVDQIGATTLHKTLLQLLSRHGVRVTETYQLDVGGGAESLDTLERTRELKRIVKTETVKAALPYEAEVVAGSTDYVDFLQNRRDSYFWIRGLYFCGTPMQIDMRLSTVDAPNAGSVLFRCHKGC
jgi:myo-inositol-1-phosphate synthase